MNNLIFRPKSWTNKVYSSMNWFQENNKSQRNRKDLMKFYQSNLPRIFIIYYLNLVMKRNRTRRTCLLNLGNSVSSWKILSSQKHKNVFNVNTESQNSSFKDSDNNGSFWNILNQGIIENPKMIPSEKSK